MNAQKQKRKRGIILTSQGFKKLQVAKSEAESCENAGKSYTLDSLSDRTGLNRDTLIKVFACEVGVDKRTLNRCFKAFNLKLESNDYQQPIPDFNQPENLEKAQNYLSQIPNQFDWGNAPESGVFYGRTEELATLKHWFLNDRCRVVALLGMGGIGKTCLSVQLTLHIQNKFELVIWRSLRHAPPLTDLLAELCQFILKEQETNLPATVAGRIALLISYLRSHRCLLLLDNMETIFHCCDPQNASCNYLAGHYREGYENYGEFLRQVGETSHQSCLLLTSREKPKEIGRLEGETLPVRSLQVKGLPTAEGQKILTAHGCFWESLIECSRLVEFYAGNPLALKLVSTTIQKLFAGSISEFLKHQIAVFGEIRNLLGQQFERLSDAEKYIVKWLSINGKPASFSELQEQILPTVSPPKLLEAIESLLERSLIEKSAILFSLQPMVMEYVKSN
jgi:hypothetical protein